MMTWCTTETILLSQSRQRDSSTSWSNAMARRRCGSTQKASAINWQISTPRSIERPSPRTAIGSNSWLSSLSSVLPVVWAASARNSAVNHTLTSSVTMAASSPTHTPMKKRRSSRRSMMSTWPRRRRTGQLRSLRWSLMQHKRFPSKNVRKSL